MPWKLDEDRPDRFKISGRTPFSNQNMHPRVGLVTGFLERKTLVIGGDPGGGIALCIFAAKAWGVTVNWFAESLGGGDLGHDLGVIMKHPWPIHHFAEISKTIICQKSLDRHGIDPFAGGLEVGRRDTAGDSEVDRHACPVRLGQHEFEAFLSQDVGDLVWITDRGHGAVSDRDPCELRRRKHAALDVDVGVDKARQEESRIDRLIISKGMN